MYRRMLPWAAWTLLLVLGSGIGLTSVAGQRSAKDCAAGEYWTGQYCSFCARNSYSKPGATSCTPCPKGQAQTKGGDSCAPCPAGQYGSTSGCSYCPGTSYSKPGATACTPCPKGQGQAASGDTCILCPAGQYLTSFGCTKCSSGFYSPQPGATRCLPCPLGLSSQAGATTCVPCASGRDGSFYDSLGGFCQNCTRFVGFSNFTVSSPGRCSAGKGRANCDDDSPCLTCAAGLYSALSNDRTRDVCKPCPRGTFSSTAGAAKCNPCPAGRISLNVAATACNLSIDATWKASVTEYINSTTIVYLGGQVSWFRQNTARRTIQVTSGQPAKATSNYVLERYYASALSQPVDYAINKPTEVAEYTVYALADKTYIIAVTLADSSSTVCTAGKGLLAVQCKVVDSSQVSISGTTALGEDVDLNLKQVG